MYSIHRNLVTNNWVQYLHRAWFAPHPTGNRWLSCQGATVFRTFHLLYSPSDHHLFKWWQWWFPQHLPAKLQLDRITTQPLPYSSTVVDVAAWALHSWAQAGQRWQSSVDCPVYWPLWVNLVFPYNGLAHRYLAVARWLWISLVWMPKAEIEHMQGIQNEPHAHQTSLVHTKTSLVQPNLGGSCLVL